MNSLRINDSFYENTNRKLWNYSAAMERATGLLFQVAGLLSELVKLRNKTRCRENLWGWRVERRCGDGKGDTCNRVECKRNWMM